MPFHADKLKAPSNRRGLQVIIASSYLPEEISPAGISTILGFLPPNGCRASLGQSLRRSG